MSAGNSKRGGLTNPDKITAQMVADSTGHRAGDRMDIGLTNPMELCARNGGPDDKVKGPSQKDLTAPRLPQRLHEHPDSSRMNTGGDQRQ